jgi:Ca2+-binding RTX toxin-like protein
MKQHTKNNNAQDGKALLRRSNLNNPLSFDSRYRNQQQNDDCGSSQYRPHISISQLQIWTDSNQDGYASAGERQSLADLGIVSIDLDPLNIKTQTIAGKASVKGVVATYSNGTTRTLWDVPFTDVSTAGNAVTTTKYNGSVDKISSNGQIALKAMSSLGVAINLQGSGATQAIGSFGNDTLTGTSGEDWLIGGAGSDTFNAGAGNDLLVIDAEDQQANIDAGAGIDTVLVADDRGVFLNLAKTHSEVVYGGYGDDVFIGGGTDNAFIVRMMTKRSNANAIVRYAA